VPFSLTSQPLTPTTSGDRISTLLSQSRVFENIGGLDETLLHLTFGWL